LMAADSGIARPSRWPSSLSHSCWIRNCR
jgi:hypothetical protein